MTFDGSNDILLTNNAGALNVANVSFFAVMRYVSAAGEDVPFGIGSTQNADRIRVLYRSSGGTSLGFAAWGNDIASSSLSSDTGGGYHLFEAVQDSASVFLWRNGVADTTTPRTLPRVPQPVSTSGASLGSLQGGLVGSYYSNISVSEVLAIYSAVSTSTRQMIEGYLAHKWGLQGSLPSNHPHKAAPP